MIQVRGPFPGMPGPRGAFYGAPNAVLPGGPQPFSQPMPPHYVSAQYPAHAPKSADVRLNPLSAACFPGGGQIPQIQMIGPGAIPRKPAGYGLPDTAMDPLSTHQSSLQYQKMRPVVYNPAPGSVTAGVPWQLPIQQQMLAGMGSSPSDFPTPAHPSNGPEGKLQGKLELPPPPKVLFGTESDEPNNIPANNAPAGDVIAESKSQVADIKLEPVLSAESLNSGSNVVHAARNSADEAKVGTDGDASSKILESSDASSAVKNGKSVDVQLLPTAPAEIAVKAVPRDSLLYGGMAMPRLVSDGRGVLDHQRQFLGINPAYQSQGQRFMYPFAQQYPMMSPQVQQQMMQMQQMQQMQLMQQQMQQNQFSAQMHQHMQQPAPNSGAYYPQYYGAYPSTLPRGMPPPMQYGFGRDTANPGRPSGRDLN
jgi:hypothetical protein